MEIVVGFVVGVIGCVLISLGFSYAVKKITGTKQGNDKAFFAKREQDYMFGKPPTREERRAMRSNSPMRR